MVLARHGITPIETKVGEPFDSNGHEAITVVQTDEMEPGRVVEELQRGFRLHGRVLRPARVAVSAAKNQTCLMTTKTPSTNGNEMEQ